MAAIGSTPTIKLEQLFPHTDHDFYAKLEYLNPGGSLKDRSSSIMVQEAITLGKISSETTIIESTSGNMGVGLAKNLSLFWITAYIDH